MTEAAIEVRGLTKSYGPVHAVKGVDLTVATGEIFALLGPNGAGKTTTVEILEGFTRRDGGEVRVFGKDPARAGWKQRARIGIVPQETTADPFLTVTELLRMIAGTYPHPRPVDEVIETVGLEDKRTTRAGRLSGGQQRRLDVALALVGDPDLLFLDEPTTGFDPDARLEAWAMVRGLEALGKTVLLTTHYIDEAQQLADRVAVIAGGPDHRRRYPRYVGQSRNRRQPHPLPPARRRNASARRDRRPSQRGHGERRAARDRRPGPTAPRTHQLGDRAEDCARRARSHSPEPRGNLSGADRAGWRHRGGTTMIRWLGSVLHHLRYINLSFWRNPSAAFFGVIFPLMILTINGLVFGGGTIVRHGETVPVTAFFVTGMAVFAVVMTCFTNLAISVLFDRDMGRLKRIRGRRRRYPLMSRRGWCSRCAWGCSPRRCAWVRAWRCSACTRCPSASPISECVSRWGR